MGYRLGVDLGTSFTAATIGRAGTAHGSSLGTDSAIVPSVVFIGADGARLYGTAAAEAAGAEPGRVLRGFVRRIGDETPMLPEAGASSAAHRVAADFVAWVVTQASVQEGREPDAVAVTHPATWGPHKRDLFAAALREAGVPGATLVSAPVAAAAAGTPNRSHPAGAVVAVYDLGGRTFDAALVRREASGAWSTIGRPAGLPDLGGADLDDLVLAHVVAGLTPDQQQVMAQLDADDAATAAALTSLRANCVQAKEALSADTVASIEVKLPGLTSKVRLTRSEFESMITASVEATVDVLDSVFDTAGLAVADVDCILVAGGSSRIPLVTQLLSRQFQIPVLAAGGPKAPAAIAGGAVQALAHLVPVVVTPKPAVVEPAVELVSKSAAKASRAARKVAGKSAAVPAPSKPMVQPVAESVAAPVAEPVAETKPVAQPAAVAKAVAPVAPPKLTSPAKPAPVATSVAITKAAPATKPAPVAKVVAPAETEAPVAAAPAVAAPLSAPSGPNSKPIRPRRQSRRSEIVGLEGLTQAAPAARADEAPALQGPRAVVSARAVHSVDALLTKERVLTARVVDQLPPPRPALDDAVFAELAEVVEIEQLRDGWTWRSVVSIRRSLALTALTAAIYVGATAWIPATPAITEAPSHSTLKVAAAKHTAP